MSVNFRLEVLWSGQPFVNPDCLINVIAGVSVQSNMQVGHCNVGTWHTHRRESVCACSKILKRQIIDHTVINVYWTCYDRPSISNDHLSLCPLRSRYKYAGLCIYYFLNYSICIGLWQSTLYEPTYTLLVQYYMFSIFRNHVLPSQRRDIKFLS